MVMNAPCLNGRCGKQAQSERGRTLSRNEVKSKTSMVQGKLCEQKKNRYLQERKGFMPAPPAFRKAEFVDKLNVLCIPNLHRKCACRSFLFLCKSGKMRKSREKKRQNELGTQVFFSEYVGLGLLCSFVCLFEWAGVSSFCATEQTSRKLAGCDVGMTQKFNPMQPPTEVRSTWLAEYADCGEKMK